MAGTLTVVARIYPKPGKEDEVAALLVRMAEAVRRAEPDCLVYRPHRLDGDPVVFLYYEQYRSDTAFDFHKTAPHLAASCEQMKTLVSRPTDIERYRALTD